MQVNLGGTLDLNGNNQSVANLNSAGLLSGTGGSIINSGAAATFRIGFNASQTWSGGINGANINVVRDGAGTWTVNSANSFAGTLVLQREQLYARYRWKTTPYRHWIFLEGVGFTHVPMSIMQKPIGGRYPENTIGNQATHS